MTATLTPPQVSRDVRRRPLPLLATLAGLTAAALPLAACAVVALAGWFATDAGAHGAPRDALRTGATAWLVAHGSGVEIRNTLVTAVPLGITLLAAWTLWRTALRLGESVAGHGPDADALADGERDWTVGVATALYAAAYVVAAVVTVVLAGAATGVPGIGPVLGWSLLLSVLLGAPGIAVGSGRAAVWLSLAPAAVRATTRGVASVLLTVLGGSAVVLLVALALDLGEAATVLSRLHTDTDDAAVVVLLVLTLVPNAVVFAASYLLGPGFLVGTGTLVSPSVVAVGPVPMFPLLAALPDNGPVPVWTPYLVAIPVVCAFVGALRAGQRYPTAAWDQGALRGVVAGVVAGVLLGVLAALAGGAVGPGRMADVGPVASQVLVHAVVALGIGGLLGGLASVWRTRRRLAG